MKRPILVVAILLVSIFAVGTVAGNDLQDINNCEDAPVLEPGTYTSTITPSATHLFRINNVSQGDSLVFETEFDENDIGVIYIRGADNDWGDIQYDEESYAGHDYLSSSSDDYDTHSRTLWTNSGGVGELWVENEKSPCIFLGADGGGTYSMSFAVNEPEPPTTDTEKDIEELQERIAELEAELEEAEVTIDVSVEPASQSFQVGSEMAVSVETSEQSVRSDVVLSFDDQQYFPDGGDVMIPLESAGTETLSIEYEETTESVTIDVVEADTATEDKNQEDGSSGFGAVAAFTALLASLLVIQRRHNS